MAEIKIIVEKHSDGYVATLLASRVSWSGVEETFEET